jgi:hypothetical protein
MTGQHLLDRTGHTAVRGREKAALTGLFVGVSGPLGKPGFAIIFNYGKSVFWNPS